MAQCAGYVTVSPQTSPYAGPFCVLLDAPTSTATAKVQIAKVGKGYRDARYGVFDITSDQVSRWSQNLAKLPGGRAPIDLDHLADRPDRRTEAAGWILGVTLEGGVPFAEVEWTPLGKQAIEDRRYLFFSPTYGPWTDEHGATTQDVLMGGALTNRPFLNMPAISLSAAYLGGALEPTPTTTRSADVTTFQDLLYEEGTVTLDRLIIELSGTLGMTYQETYGKVDEWQAAAAARRARASNGTMTLAKAEKAITAIDVVSEALRERHADVLPAEQLGPVPAGHDARSFHLDKRARAYQVTHPDVDYIAAVEAVSD
jgi:hypothetical protein